MFNYVKFYKKAYFAALFFINLILFSCTSQSNKQVEKNLINKSSDISAFNDYEEHTLPDSLLSHIYELGAKAEKENDLEALLSVSAILSVKKIREGRLDEGVRISEEMLERIIQSNDSLLIPKAYYKTGRTFFVAGMPWLGLNYFIKSADNATTSSDKAKALYAIAHSASLSQDKKGIEPLSYYELAENEARKTDDSLVISQCCFGISQEYFRSLSAHEIMNKELTPTLRDSILTAINYLEKAIDYSGEKYRTWVDRAAIGLNYAALKDFEKANYYISHEMDREPHLFETSAMALHVKAVLYTCMKNYDMALAFARRSNELAIQQHKEDDIRNSQLTIYYIYKYSGNYRLALEAFEKYEVLKEELNHKTFEQQVVMSEIRYDTKLKEEQLAASRQQNSLYLGSLKIIIAFLVLIVFLLIFIWYYYRKTRKINRELVRKNLEWAEEDSRKLAHQQQDKEEDVAGEHLILIERLNNLYAEQKIYLNPELSIGDLASKLDTNRSYLSEAINKAYDKNFNTYTNEFRVKEAINLFSDPNSDMMTIETIAAKAGFNNRTSFYQAFKKITGLTPMQFKKNRK